METKELIEKIVALLAKHKCQNIVVIDVKDKTDVAEAFVVCSARNPNLGRAAYDETTGKLEEEGIYASRADGLKDGRWIVIDYDRVIVHIFHTSMRDLYQFEKLWANEDGSNVTAVADE